MNSGDSVQFESDLDSNSWRGGAYLNPVSKRCQKKVPSLNPVSKRWQLDPMNPYDPILVYVIDPLSDLMAYFPKKKNAQNCTGSPKK